jgi:hypothetical protein
MIWVIRNKKRIPDEMRFVVWSLEDYLSLDALNISPIFTPK